VDCSQAHRKIPASKPTKMRPESTHKVGAQHTLNAEYFRRIDALLD
jgi:hypothetical protein